MILLRIKMYGNCLVDLMNSLSIFRRGWQKGQKGVKLWVRPNWIPFLFLGGDGKKDKKEDEELKMDMDKETK